MLQSAKPKQALTPALTLTLPLLIFILMRLPWASFVPAWFLGWYYQGSFHYYAVYLASLMSLIAAFFSAAALGRHENARTLFITIAFSAMAALSLLSSLALPDVIVPGSTNPIFVWSWRLNTFVSALFFAAAGIQWDQAQDNWLTTHRRSWSVLLGGLFLAYVLAVAIVPESAGWLFSEYPALEITLAAATSGLLIWAAWRSWRQYCETQKIVERRLAVTMALLAQAHLFRLATSDDGVGWWFYQLLILMALSVALRAILAEFEAMRDLRPARYFFALGSVLILGLSLAGGEIAARWMGATRGHWITIGLALAQGGLAFLVLYLIVLRLDRLITERTRELEQSQIRRGDLTRLIVHDLTNPLTVISASIELLDQGYLGPTTDQQDSALKLLTRSSQNVLRMIEDMIDVDRVESGTLDLRRTHIDPASLLIEVEEQAKILVENTGQVITFNRNGAVPEILGDKVLLNRVILNLVDNAAKFSPPGGRITVSASGDDKQFALDITDDGPRVQPANRDRLFSRLEQTKGLERRGKGVSLSFCKLVVVEHGGTLIVDDNPDGGMRFRMTLPVQHVVADDLAQLEAVR